MESPIHNPRLDLFDAFSQRFATMRTPQPGHAIGHKASAPQAHRIDAAALLAAQLANSLAAGQLEDAGAEFGACDYVGSSDWWSL